MFNANLLKAQAVSAKFFSTAVKASESCKLLVLGGGAGGCSTAAKFVPKVPKNGVIVVEPSENHVYQPMLTLVGGGVKRTRDATRPSRSCLPRGAKWIKDSVAAIDPVRCTVTTSQGTTINYEYLVVALGINLLFDKVPGLVEGLEAAGSGVCSNYSPLYAEKTFASLNSMKNGNAVFTVPSTPIKCGGAPLKACLISDNHLRTIGVRDDCKVYYKSSLPVIFTVKHYADKLMELCKQRDIQVDFRQELVEVRHKTNEAVFKNIDRPNDVSVIKFGVLHAVPPMGPPAVLAEAPNFTDAAGYVKINKASLRHDVYPNVFAIGDCSNLPTSKTAAAVAAQSGVLYDNLTDLMKGGAGNVSRYDGYTSCPLVTRPGSCIMAEFDYDLKPLETFPIDQSKEHLSMYLMKKDLMPALYWNAMLKGYWRGPEMFRKILHLGMSR